MDIFLKTGLTFSLRDKRYTLEGLEAGLKGEAAGITDLEATLNGPAHLDAASEKAESNLAIRIGGSTITSKLAMSRFDAPRYTFHVAIDRLDADHYLSSGSQNRPARKSVEPEKSIDLSFLKSLRADGNLRIGDLKIYNVHASQTRAGMKAGGHNMDRAFPDRGRPCRDIAFSNGLFQIHLQWKVGRLKPHSFVGFLAPLNGKNTLLSD